MFGELQLPVFKVEVMVPGFLARANFQPKGDMLIFLNDKRYSVVRYDQVELYPAAPDAQIRGVKQEMMAFSKQHIVAISVLEQERMENLQVLSSKRPFVVYTEWFAIQGNLHVNADSRDDDVFDETRNYFGITDAIVFPLKQVRKAPTRKVPFLAINQRAITAYHPHTRQDS